MGNKLKLLSYSILVSMFMLSAVKGASYSEGYYLTLTGDTIKGYIKLTSKKEGTKTFIYYKESESAKKVKSVDPSKSKGFYLNDGERNFYSIKFPGLMGGWQFLEKVDEGYYTIYLVDLELTGYSFASSMSGRGALGNKYNYYTYDAPLLAVQTNGGEIVPMGFNWKKPLKEYMKDNKELFDQADQLKTLKVYVAGTENSRESKYKDHDYYKMHHMLLKYNEWKTGQNK